ncbi:MAG: DMT family transporter [Fervidobacterium sp.]|nr:DMT family transporter [Fervidobacterium sp.]
MSIKVFLSGLCVSFIFGLSFLFTKNSIEHVTVYTFLSYRFFVASVVMVILLVLKIVRLSKKPYWKLWRVAIFQPVLYFIFETNGLKYTTSSEAGMLIAMIPITVMILSPLTLKEKIKWYQIIFAFMSFFGVVLIIGFDVNLTGELLGKILILGAVFSAAFYNISSRRLSEEFRPEEITFFMMLTGFVFFTLLSITTGQFSLNLSFPVVIGALYLGVLSSTVAFFLVNYMLSKVSPTVSSLFSNLTTIVSVLAGSVIRHETIKSVQIVGMCLILIALFGNSYLRQKKL